MAECATQQDLRNAFSKGDIATCRRLLDGGLSVQSVYQGYSLLYWSALCGHSAICQLLIDRGADVNSVEFEGKRPLHAAVASDCGEGYPDICAMLVKAGANIDARDVDGMTPVRLAQMTKQDDINGLFADMVQPFRALPRSELRRVRSAAVHGAPLAGQSHGNPESFQEWYSIVASVNVIERIMHQQQ